jgi:hypothetical protein
MNERRRSPGRPAVGRSDEEKPRSRRRLLVVVAGLAIIGGMLTVAQISSAGTNHRQGQRPCAPASGEASAAGAHNHGSGTQSTRNRGCTTSAPASSPTSPAANPVVQPESPGQSCDNSSLTIHDGFQNGDRCVSVDRGEVPTADNSPSLIIVSAPRRVRVNQPFEIRIATRNLKRDFFLPAATGGYYATRSFLDENGILHGHVHTSIRPLTSTRVPPEAGAVPTFFKATEDGGGGREPDTFVVEVPGIATPGFYQIASWAGDASHGVPMAQRANQTPCFDAVRLFVTR